MVANIDERLLRAAGLVTSHRPKIVIDHIIKHRFVTTEELKSIYGYNHPPRAAMDVKDQGIPLETFKVVGTDGRNIAAYRFGDPSKIRRDKLGGRKAFSPRFKKALLDRYGSRCSITGVACNSQSLQIDHRIPYGITGDADGKSRNIDDYMLLTGAAQRQKSWACEHCENFTKILNPNICRMCYWAYPDSHDHVAMIRTRRLDIEWAGDAETNDFEQVSSMAKAQSMTLQEFVKRALKRIIRIAK